MSWARLASVLGFIAGLMLAPLSHSQIGHGLTPEQLEQLEEIKRQLAPAPYVPSNAPGCERWKGRAVIVRPTPDRLCSSGCQMELEEEWGESSRWVVTGQRCQGRPQQARQIAPGSTQPVARAQVAERVALPRYVAPMPARGQAKNHGPGQQIIDGPPPGFRAAPARK